MVPLSKLAIRPYGDNVDFLTLNRLSYTPLLALSHRMHGRACSIHQHSAAVPLPVTALSPICVRLRVPHTTSRDWLNWGMA